MPQAQTALVGGNQMEQNKDILALYAELFGYPGQGYAAVLGRCRTRLAEICPEAAQQLEPLSSRLAQGSLKDLEELYTRTFDMQPRCCPYIGYQLCGESRERTLFLLKLREIYLQHRFDEGGELPDHLGVVLRFLAQNVADEECEIIIRDGMLPALEKMIGLFETEPRHPYGTLLVSLQQFLAQQLPDAAVGQKEVAQ